MTTDILGTVFLSTDARPVVVSRAEKVVVPVSDAPTPLNVATAGCEIGMFRRSMQDETHRTEFFETLALTLTRLRRTYGNAAGYCDDVVVRFSDDGRLMLVVVWADFATLGGVSGDDIRTATGLPWMNFVPQWTVIPGVQIASDQPVAITDDDRNDPLFREAMAYLRKKIRFE